MGMGRTDRLPKVHQLHNRWTLSLSLLIILSGVWASDPCSSLNTCGECIQVPNCVWCSKPVGGANSTLIKKTDELHRCQRRDAMTDCPADLLQDPKPIYKIVHDKKPRSIIRPTNNVQLRPQGAILKDLRVGEAYNISLQFKVAKDYPLDLYYLMDVSLSMYDDKKNLVRLADSLANAIRDITSDFKLGFGSFLDKNLLPFVEKTTETCASDLIGCGISYSFQNQLPLNSDVEEFKSKVNSTPTVGSKSDPPEAGLDALLQAIVCQDEIKWGNLSRRLVVFVTDALPHMAGNGRYGGVIRPNDGLCHLNDEDGMYLKAELQDYPSIGQIGRVAKEYAMNLIFAVTEDVEPFYSVLSAQIEGSSVGTLSSDSENIVELIRTKYKAITSSVELRDTADKGVKLRYFTACTGNSEHENNKCDSLKVGDTINFTVSIEATECPSNPEERVQTLQIYPVGVNEIMQLKLEVLCDCPCERPDSPDYVVNATECNYGGDLQCGVCSCDASHTGEHCECSGDVSIVQLESQCKVDNSSKIVCSGRGDCVCGKCDCQRFEDPSKVISGKFCECDNFSCEWSDEQICGGRGDCVCGECVCFDGWKGSACSCSSSQDSCIPIDDQQICSGRGTCVCGACECDANAQGKFCEDCPTCPSRCEEFQPCVQCKVFQSGPYESQEECDSRCPYSIIAEEEIYVEEASERDCSYEDEKQCTIKYVYGYDRTTGARKIRVQKNPVCSTPVPALALGLSLLVIIIIGGIVFLLFFKISTYLYDKRQYAKFLEDQKNGTWRDGNPIYQEPVTTFKNPVYGN